MPKRVLMIIAPKGFRDEELFHTKEELETRGNEVKIASLSRKEAIGMLGGRAAPDLTLDEVNVDEFDAVVFVGGVGSSIYFNNERAHEIAKKAYEQGKIVAAICIAPSTLANAGLLRGKRATSWSSEAGNLKNKGAIYTGKPVEKDGNIITAEGPHAAREFGRKIADSL